MSPLWEEDSDVVSEHQFAHLSQFPINQCALLRSRPDDWESSFVVVCFIVSHLANTQSLSGTAGLAFKCYILQALIFSPLETLLSPRVTPATCCFCFCTSALSLFLRCFCAFKVCSNRRQHFRPGIHYLFFFFFLSPNIAKRS